MPNNVNQKIFLSGCDGREMFVPLNYYECYEPGWCEERTGGHGTKRWTWYYFHLGNHPGNIPSHSHILSKRLLSYTALLNLLLYSSYSSTFFSVFATMNAIKNILAPSGAQGLAVSVCHGYKLSRALDLHFSGWNIQKVLSQLSLKLLHHWIDGA